jgi:hypothetical protein
VQYFHLPETVLFPDANDFEIFCHRAKSFWHLEGNNAHTELQPELEDILVHDKTFQSPVAVRFSKYLG